MSADKLLELASQLEHDENPAVDAVGRLARVLSGEPWVPIAPPIRLRDVIVTDGDVKAAIKAYHEGMFQGRFKGNREERAMRAALEAGARHAMGTQT